MCVCVHLRVWQICLTRATDRVTQPLRKNQPATVAASQQPVELITNKDLLESSMNKHDLVAIRLVFCPSVCLPIGLPSAAEHPPWNAKEIENTGTDYSCAFVANLCLIYNICAWWRSNITLAFQECLFSILRATFVPNNRSNNNNTAKEPKECHKIILLLYDLAEKQICQYLCSFFFVSNLLKYLTAIETGNESEGCCCCCLFLIGNYVAKVFLENLDF